MTISNNLPNPLHLRVNIHERQLTQEFEKYKRILQNKRLNFRTYSRFG